MTSRYFKQGYQLWADTVNRQGGLLGRPVVLKILNDASTPEQVTTNYQTLINVDHVDLLFAPFSSLLTKPAAKIANRYGYAFPEGAGTAPSVFALGLKNLFCVSLPASQYLTSFANYILALPQQTASRRPPSMPRRTILLRSRLLLRLSRSWNKEE